MPVAQRSPSAPMQISPGMTHPPSRLCLSDIHHGVPCKFRASTIYAALPRRAASYPLPVRQVSALPSASSRFAVAHDTLAVWLTLPLAGRVEDFHLLVSAPCRAHIKKTPGSDAIRRSFLLEVPIRSAISSSSPAPRRGAVSGGSCPRSSWAVPCGIRSPSEVCRWRVSSCNTRSTPPAWPSRPP
jgi:hypothetical protein